MKLIIAGGRDIELSHHTIEDLYNILFPIDKFKEYPLEVVSGGCSGIDKVGEEWAKLIKAEITVFAADWDTHGKAAGPIRNRQMAEYADALLLIWDGKSRGSGNMKKEMQKLGKTVHEVIIKKS